jgi:hypothetical protein
MTAGQGFDLHPLAAQDITDIWEYIAAGGKASLGCSSDAWTA